MIFCLNANGNTQMVNRDRVDYGNQAVRQDQTGRWHTRQLTRERPTLEGSEALHYPTPPPASHPPQAARRTPTLRSQSPRRRTPRQVAAMKPREDIAAMLRDGATYRQIIAQLGVGQATIAATRKALSIPCPRPHRTQPPQHRRRRRRHRHRHHAPRRRHLQRNPPPAPRQRPAHLQHPPPAQHPRTRRPLPRPPRTPHPEQTLAHYSQPAPDGHTTWTGPTDSAGKPTIWNRHKALSAWRIAFHLHHGREPEGRVTVACDQPHCITGAHLTDRRIRQANHRADQAFEQIFGSPS
ncbi:Trp family transcriptional regulator [Streptomyces noursei]|nr:Trp family transcriptional regulator [Streptomyces noursei]